MRIFISKFSYMIFIVSLLVISVLYYLIGSKSSIRKKRKKVDNSELIPPEPKNYGNYYCYLSDLQDYNDRAYKEFIEKCAKGEATFIEKEIIHPMHEKRMRDLEDLLN